MTRADQTAFRASKTAATTLYRLTMGALIMGMGIATMSLAFAPAEARETLSRPGNIERPVSGPVTEPFVGTAEGENDY